MYLNEAEAADAYACTFVGIDRCKRLLINRDIVRLQRGLRDPSSKADARGTRASQPWGSLKTGQRGSLQNRPMELSQDKLIYTLSGRPLTTGFPQPE